ncbi:MAG: tetratricopeptide repeat protein [Bacteroidota bacterium]
MRQPFFKLIFFLFFLVSTTISAQEYLSQTVSDRWYQQGMDLLDKKKFGAARESFERYITQAPSGQYATDAQYYAAYSAIRLYNLDGEAQMAQFLQEQGSHPKAIRANYELGNFYFNEQRYDKVIEYFEKTDTRNLSVVEEETRNFKLGYAYFTRKKFEEAKPLFDVLKNSENPYQNAAYYYAGYIALENGEYNEALNDLRRIENDESYGKAVPFLIANILNQQGRFDQLKNYGEKILAKNKAGSKSSVANFPEIMLLVGEANYRQQRYEDAEPFLYTYAQMRNADRGVLYRLGYAQYQLGKADEAIENLKQAALSQDSVGQFASFYLGVLYTNQDNLEYAVYAFETASQQKYDDKIREQSFFNLGKTLFAREEYGGAIQSLNRLKEEYPRTQYATEANDLLSEAYLHTQNYAAAIKFIEGLPNKTLPVRKAYQQVSYRAATQAFNQSKYRVAVDLFDKSLEYPIDRELVAAANFWKGEAYSIGKFWDKAIDSYNAVFRTLTGERLEGEKALYHTKSQYGIGYAHFNMKQYSQALTHFDKYVQQTMLRRNRSNQDEFYLADALLRLGDSYYVTKNYQKAIQTYDRAIQQRTAEAGYAYYQQGIIQGILGNSDQGVQKLDKVLNQYRDSPYYDDALFQKAQLQLQQGDYRNAIQGFTALLENQSQSVLAPYALLRRAVAYSNQQQYREAEQDYKRILDEYMSHPTANSAILGLQEVTTLSGSSSSFSAYLTKYKEANPEDANVAGIEYESAKNLYFSQQYTQAIQQLQKFADTYPDNTNTPEARYYIGESYYRLGRIEEALETYYALTAVPNHPQIQRIMQRIAELEQSQANYANAVTYFQRLAQSARTTKQRYNAWQGLMTSYYELARENPLLLDSVDYYAQQILEKANVSTNAANQASLFRGRAAYEQGNLGQAEQVLAELAQSAPDENGAEAQYLLAKIKYDRGNYQESIDALYELNKNFGGYEDWLGASFLLIAENYAASDELFQAKATLTSIIENSPQPDVVKQAQDRLSALELEEAEQQQKREAQDSAQQESENEIILEEPSNP